MERNEILIVRGRKYREMARELCSRASLSFDILDKCGSGKGILIAIKPNLLGPISASLGATTHPQVVEGVIEYLRENGYYNIVVMESSWVGDKTNDALLVTGFGELCKRLSVPFQDLQNDSSVAVDCAGMKLHVCRKALLPDYFINIPVLKGHCQTVVTCALKNMKGCIPASEKRRFHRMGLHAPIGHLSAGLRQNFILADAICPDLTFEDGGNPTPLYTLLCCFDPVMLDTYACLYVGVDPKSVEYIRIAQKCGVGISDLSKLKKTSYLEKCDGGMLTYIEGDVPIPSASEKGRSSLIRLKEKVGDLLSCSACYGSLLPALARLEEEGVLSALHETVCIGQGYRGERGILGIGNCTRLFDNYLEGCPPSSECMYGFLKKYAQKN